MNIDIEVLEYPEKCLNFYRNNFKHLNESQRLTLFNQIIKSDYCTCDILQWIFLNEIEKKLVIERNFNKRNYILCNLIKHTQNLSEKQIDKIDSLLIFGKLTGEI